MLTVLLIADSTSGAPIPLSTAHTHAIPDPASMPPGTQSFELSQLGVAYLTQWSLYVCISCAKGLSPADIKAHMGKHHDIATTPQWKEHLDHALRLYPGRDPAFLDVSSISAGLQTFQGIPGDRF